VITLSQVVQLWCEESEKSGDRDLARAEAQIKPVGFLEAFWFWVKLGFINFGGPAGQIAIMHRELVEKKRWISEGQYLRTLNFCMLLPGPEAQQVATYIGWRLHGTLGGIVAGSFFVIPSIFVLWLLSYLGPMLLAQKPSALLGWALPATLRTSPSPLLSPE
jgi:chromate transport protein ChrA